MTATVTDIRTPRHSWDKKPRRDDPNRHVYTCRRPPCGLMKRSELVDGQWVEVWRWPDGVEGQGVKVPSCRPVEAGGELVPAPPVEAPTQPQVAQPDQICARCNPPCGRPGKPYLGGISCTEVVAAAGLATREWIRGMQGGAA